MPETLALLETRAAKDYSCPACGGEIKRGTQHFRHDPHPYARIFRGLKVSHWCFACVTSFGVAPDPKTRRIIIGSDKMLTRLHVPLVQFVRPAAKLVRAIFDDPSNLKTLTPDQLEEFICDRLFARGYEPKRTGAINRKDGGLDVVFWPRASGTFPFLGGVQVRSARPGKNIGPRAVRELDSAITRHSFNMGLLVTNTGFTPDARWWAKAKPAMLRLHDFDDLVRWARDEFDSPEEWRDLPEEIELCPGVTISLRPKT